MNNYQELRGSQTLTNLAKAFVGESQARNRYLFYSEIARKEKQMVLEEVFLETADNERGHGEIFYEYLTAGMNDTLLEPTVWVPVAMGSIPQNLSAASKGEYEEWSRLYPSYGQTAMAEGFETIANSFFAIASIEKHHDMRFREYLECFNTSTLYHSDNAAEWICLNCGYRHNNNSAPDICPACLHSQEYFKMACRVPTIFAYHH